MIATSSDFFILCWLAAAAVGGVIGAAKGRAFAGAIWGFLLGPIGWLVIAAAPDQRPKCPECGGDTISGANRCKNCGYSLHGFDDAENRSRYGAVTANARQFDIWNVIICVLAGSILLVLLANLL